MDRVRAREICWRTLWLVLPLLMARATAIAREALCEGLSSEPLAGADEDLPAFHCFPPAHWSELRSTNPLELVNRGIGRRADIMADRAAIRLASALLIEQNDEWLVSCRLLLGEALRSSLPTRPTDRGGDPELQAA
jgi:hypothetical protein